MTETIKQLKEQLQRKTAECKKAQKDYREMSQVMQGFHRDLLDKESKLQIATEALELIHNTGHCMCVKDSEQALERIKE